MKLLSIFKNGSTQVNVDCGLLRKLSAKNTLDKPSKQPISNILF